MTCEEGKVYVGQIGVLFEAETQKPNCPPVDWSDATLTEIIFLLPGNIVKKFNATVFETKLEFITTQATDLPVAGKYKWQAHIVGPGYDVLGETVETRIWAPFK